MKKTIIRKDGIEYQRNARDVICDKTLTIRLPQCLLDDIKYVAEKNNIKWNTMARNVIEQYVKKEIRKFKKGDKNGTRRIK